MTNPISPSLPDEDELYAALVERRRDYDGRAFVGITTTGIFCRLSCPARKPRRAHARFFPTAAACLAAGFRPCKRCRPLCEGAPEPLVGQLLAALEQDPARRWSENDLAAMGLDPSTVRRAFRRALGTTFLELARLHRVQAGVAARQAGHRVIDAQLDAGFDSASGFRASFARLLGRAPGEIRSDAEMVAHFISTPLGLMIAVADRDVLWLLEFADRRELPRELGAVESEAGAEIGFGASPVIDALEAQLSDYFAGNLSALRLPPKPYGTAFSRQVHAGLKTIPPGTTLSYRALAERLGRPTASRAVARANAANRLAIIVPCHRVIASDGTIAGYAGGVWRKEWLLDHERRNHDRGRGGDLPDATGGLGSGDDLRPPRRARQRRRSAQ